MIIITVGVSSSFRCSAHVRLPSWFLAEGLTKSFVFSLMNCPTLWRQRQMVDGFGNARICILQNMSFLSFVQNAIHKDRTFMVIIMANMWKFLPIEAHIIVTARGGLKFGEEVKRSSPGRIMVSKSDVDAGISFFWTSAVQKLLFPHELNNQLSLQQHWN